MKTLIAGRSRVLALVAAAVFLALVAWMALASVPVESAETGQDRTEVSSPGDMITFGGELLRP